jgi:hypothetical protein
MSDTIRERENELLTYLRSNMTDPSSRGTTKTDTFTATSGQTTFTLTTTSVKYVTSITINSTTKYIGYNYNVAYGEGTAATIVTLTTGATLGDTIAITYKYGETMIYEGYQRIDASLPRIAIIPSNWTTEFMSIGEQNDGGNWIYYICTYTAEIRSRFAKQMKDVLFEFSNLINKFRQTTPQPYRVITAYINNVYPQDFDPELRLYRGDVLFTVKWMVKFKD